MEEEEGGGRGRWKGEKEGGGERGRRKREEEDGGRRGRRDWRKGVKGAEIRGSGESSKEMREREQ